jgi:microsomal dipeptidase-like Zn-dependent dipeptidase
MIVDLHAHFPMHLLPPEQRDTHAWVLKPWPGSRWRSMILQVLSKRFNYEGPNDTPGVRVDLMKQGDVGAALSVLYAPFDEMDLEAPYGAPPRSRYVKSLQDQMDLVEQAVAADAQNAGMARNPKQLKDVMDSGRVAIVHCVEGGFALGADEAEVAATVKAFAERGVAYVTLAHLFYRGVAQNAPALPFLPDPVYKLVFPQKGRTGLTPLGEAAVRVMVEHRVLVDVTHMNDVAIAHTLKVLDQTGSKPPLIASHIACRLGKAGYNLSDDAIREIGARGGVIGVIACEHWATDGLKKATTFAESVDTIDAHIKRIHRETGSFDNIAIGSDIDGFIKPALTGIEHMGCMKALEDALIERYDATLAEKFCSGNMLALLDRYWRGASGPD